MRVVGFLVALLVTASAFPQIIWTYWMQGYSQVSLFTQLCIRNKQKRALEAGWEMKLLSDEDLHLYVDTKRIENLIQTSGMTNPAFKADVVRMLLIEKYGGMWMDANTFLIESLDWIETFPLRNPLPHPQIILGASSPTGQLIVDGVDLGSIGEEGILKEVNYENWFILAEPHTEFFRDCLKKLDQIVSMPKDKANQLYRSQGIHIVPSVFWNSYFVASNYVFQVVLQTKRNELESRNDTTLPYAYYGISHLESSQTVFSYFDSLKWMNLIIMLGLRLPQPHPNSPFLKFVGWQHPTVTEYFNNYVAMNCWTDYPILVSNESVWYKYLLADATDVPVVHDIVEFNRKYAEGSSPCEQQPNPPFISILLLKFGPLSLTFLFVWACFGFGRLAKQTKQVKQKDSSATLTSNQQPSFTDGSVVAT